MMFKWSLEKKENRKYVNRLSVASYGDVTKIGSETSNSWCYLWEFSTTGLQRQFTAKVPLWLDLQNAGH